MNLDRLRAPKNLRKYLGNLGVGVIGPERMPTRAEGNRRSLSDLATHPVPIRPPRDHSGTAEQRTRLPRLGEVVPVAWMLANYKNGVNSYEIHRAIGVTQNTAWFMLHRIPEATKDSPL